MPFLLKIKNILLSNKKIRDFASSLKSNREKRFFSEKQKSFGVRKTDLQNKKQETDIITSVRKFLPGRSDRN